MSPITTHVLDTAKGCPAKGIAVVLEKFTTGDVWQQIGSGTTNQDGRITDLTSKNQFTTGKYRLTFHVEAYHSGQGFFPQITIFFNVKNPDQHHHVPLLLSPFGFSTYRGS